MFKVGDFIRFKYTGARAEILEDHLDGSYTVWLEEDREEGIAFKDDILLDSEFTGKEESVFQKKHKKKKVASTESLFFSKEELEKRKKETLLAPLRLQNPKMFPISKPKNAEPPSFIAPKIQETGPSNQGMFIAFVEQEMQHYSIYLINDTARSFHFEYQLFLKQKENQSFKKIIPAYAFFPIGDLFHNQLNDQVSIQLQLQVLDWSKVVKIKYKKFIKSFRNLPLMGIESPCFLIFDKIPSNKEQNAKKTLLDYTQTHLLKNEPIQKSIPRAENVFSLIRHANFSPELDLHIEKLVPDSNSLEKNKILKTQLEHCKYFLETAIQLDIEEVFIIHGIGNGKLRYAIQKELYKIAEVASFKNEYHPKYGFGATQVTLNNKTSSRSMK